jgi:hypothetical protein
MEALSELLYKLILYIILHASRALPSNKRYEREPFSYFRTCIVQRIRSVDQVPVQRM